MSEDCPHCIFEKTEANCRGCFEGSHYRPKPITNADRIRAMTDEELASLLMYFADDTGEIDEKDYDAFCDMEWRERMLRWLKQEIKE